jgi:glycosyltransferase involved in cell wall biosynthesis
VTPPLTVGLHVGQLQQPVPGGIGRYVHGLLTGLSDPDLGRPVAVVPFAAGPRPRDPDARLRGYVDLGRPHGRLRYELWHRLRWPPVRLGVDLVHAPSLAVPPTGRAPLVVTIHDVAFLRHPEAFTRHGVAFHRRGLALAYRDAAAVITASTFARDELLRAGFDAGRLHVAPHGVVLPDPEPADVVATRLRRVGVSSPFALAVGTIEPRKGLDVLAAAVGRARVRVPELTLAVVGPRGWLAVAGLDAPGIRELGPVDERTLDALYRRATLCAVPSRYEGFGLPALEAMARGCPVVASDATSLPEVVGDAGRLVAPQDVDAWAAALVQLFTEPAARAELAAGGRARASEFSWTRSARAHLDAYRAAARVAPHP